MTTLKVCRPDYQAQSLTQTMLKQKCLRVLLCSGGIALLFVLYSVGLSHNPPGFYVDECALAYNAYLVAHTGVGEFGPRFPLYFEVFTNGFTAYMNPTQIYLLAVMFLVFPPGILVARIFSAFWIFAACPLLGFLATRLCKRQPTVGTPIWRYRAVGLIVAATALLTPWLFELSRLVLEVHFLPFALVLLLLAVHSARARESWRWYNIAAVTGTLTLLTYCYTSGRVLGPLLALGLLFFATSKRRLAAIATTWLLYGIALIPILVFNRRHPAALTKRLYEVSYIRPRMSWSEIASRFFSRYLEDQSLTGLLLTGDYHPRHHVQGSGGAIFFATFILAVTGLLFVIARRRRDRWWWFIVYGLAISIVPGAITVEPFHALRLIGYPVFLLLLTVPALEWLLVSNEQKEEDDKPHEIASRKQSRDLFHVPKLSRSTRLGVLAFLLILTVVQAVQFQTIFRRDGPKREFDYDVPYKAAYDAAVAQPNRPIYLEDGFWGPAYIHAFWYATVEGRPTSEFVHLERGVKPPSGAIVISSEQACQNCGILKRSGVYLLYKSN